MKKIALIGSTGSIGEQVLEIVRNNRDKYSISALVAHSNSTLLLKQASEFCPNMVGIINEAKYLEVSEHIDKHIEVICGEKALITPATIDCDLVVVSVVGMSGLLSVISALNSGHDIALANKEALVTGGEKVIELAKIAGKRIFPIDSEHSAIWQCLNFDCHKSASEIILTASGGPFFNKTAAELSTVTIKDTLRHPTWQMGAKITVDSATMMNKALEIIEAHWLFDCKKISYIIHPQSVVHSMVKFCDGSVLAQLSRPTMLIPINLALGYPVRLPTAVQDIPFNGLNLTFHSPREDVFIAPKIAKQCLATGGNSSVLFNAMGEESVKLYLEGSISFMDIMHGVEKCLEKQPISYNYKLEDIFEFDKEARIVIKEYYRKKLGS